MHQIDNTDINSIDLFEYTLVYMASNEAPAREVFRQPEKSKKSVNICPIYFTVFKMGCELSER